jgi:hypothetical protein
LGNFENRFGSLASDIANPLNFHSATQSNSETVRQWADRILLLTLRAFPTLANLHTQAVTRLCFRVEDGDEGFYALDGQPKTVEEAVDRMEYFKHTHQNRPPKPVACPVELRSRESFPQPELQIRPRGVITDDASYGD